MGERKKRGGGGGCSGLVIGWKKFYCKSEGEREREEKLGIGNFIKKFLNLLLQKGFGG